MEFILSVLNMLDATISALFSIPIFAIFLGGFLSFAALGVFLLLKDVTFGKSRR